MAADLVQKDQVVILVCQLVRYNDSKAYILQAKNMAFKKSA
jgi:hypothetical protein